MSLASLLLGKSTSTPADADLDAVFTRTKVEKPAIVAPAQASTSRNKIAPPQEIIKLAKIAKAKAGAKASNDSSSTPATTTGKRGGGYATSRTAKALAQKRLDALPNAAKQKQIESAPAAITSTPSSSSKKRRRESNAGDETLQSIVTDMLAASEDEEEDEDDSEDDEYDQPLVHETLVLQNGNASTSSASLQSRAKKAAKYAGESKTDKDARTTFIGNVPVACATNKSLKKALVRHLIATLPEEHRSIAKMDSIRFRSIQLATAAFASDGRDTAESSTQGGGGGHNNNEDDDEEEDDDEDDVDDVAEADKPINHARKRSRRWKTGEVETPSSGKKPMKFLTASQKKKIGFIKGQVHEKASTCISYIVWDIATPHHHSQSSESKTTKESKSVTVTPQEIASLIVKYGDNTVFENITLRVDHVKGSSSSLSLKDKSTTEEGDEGELEEGGKTKRELAIEQKQKLEEEKRTLYIGSLDFEEKEQSIRELCENLMIEERGKSTNDNDDGHPASWVERVRLVRDPETGLGKGFAYVMFKDRECVDEMLALDSIRVKLSKRKLRLERCKTSSAKAAAAYKAAKEAAQQARKEKLISDRKALNTPRRGTFDSSKLPIVPKMREPRPDIGEQLKNLSKDERRSLKLGDDERLARRLEKKNAKRQEIRIEKQKEVLDKKIKSAGGSSYKARIDPAKEGMKRSKRMRSDNAVFAKNKKKSS